MNRHNIKALFLAILVMVLSVVWLRLRSAPEVQTATSANTQTSSNGLESPAFDKNLYSIDQDDSLWVIVNKQRALSINYQPPDLVTPGLSLRLDPTSEEMSLREITARAAERLFAAAAKDGIQLMLASGFRSQSTQKGLYESYAAKDGQAAADLSSARPGHSEHQTGLAFDIEPASRQCEIEQCFAELPEGQWVAAHAAEFGFIIRYGKDQEQLTGYVYEPWHLRYVGSALASELVRTRQTMEQFFGLPPALSY